MILLPADYVLLGLVVLLATLGLFRGISGTLAFVAACAVAAVAAVLAWPRTVGFTETLWIRICSTVLMTVVAFGLVRLIVKTFVNKMFAQPADALFGLVVGALLGGLVICGWALSGFHTEYSNLVGCVAGYLN